MAAYYRKRRGHRKSSGLEEAVGIAAFVATAFLYTSARNFTNSYPYAIPLFIVLVVTLLALLGWLWWYKRQGSRHLYEAYTLANIDSMSGLEFERYLADLLRRRGYTSIRLTEKYDLGIDIIAQKDGITWGIQAKRYSGLVKAAAIRQAYTALARYKCDRAMVISNSTYSRPARLLAQDTKSVLVDREELSNWVADSSNL